jgi:tRNA (cytidine/uridine-2'-O-)-methyltransferase
MNEQLHVVLVQPEIHWNTGNAGRTCLAAGAQLHLVEPLGFSLDEKQVRRAGLDYWPHVMPRLWKSWDDLELALPAIGQPVFFSTKAIRLYSEVSYARPAVLVFGRETGGLPGTIHERYADRMVRIPIESAHVRSLNLSTAVGIAAYEVLRQWREEK